MPRPLLIVTLLLFSGIATAQEPATLSDSASVSLLTMLPGDEVYSQFGHSGYRIYDPASGLDKTYNYGTFDFRQPLFVVRFARGQLDYVLDTAPFELEREKYAFLRRPMIEQQLALAPETVQRLYDLLETNALPENRAYRYDFFFDNCSTRLLEILDDALEQSGHGRLALPSATESETFRELIAPYIDDTPLLRFGINLGLGEPSDAVATPRQRSFLPTELMNQFEAATTDGQRLVAATDTVVTVEEYDGERAETDWPYLTTWLVFLFGLAMTFFGAMTKRFDSAVGRGGDAFLFTVAGIAGCLIALLWFGTEHAVTGPNLNLLWAWPTHLLAARWLRKQAMPRWMRMYLGAAAITAIATLLFWRVLPQALPGPALPLIMLIIVRSFSRLFAPTSTLTQDS